MTIVCKFQQVPLVAKGFPRGFLTIYREPRIPLKPTLNVSRTPKNKDKVQLYLEWESESILYLEWGENEFSFILGVCIKKLSAALSLYWCFWIISGQNTQTKSTAKIK